MRHAGFAATNHAPPRSPRRHRRLLQRAELHVPQRAQGPRPPHPACPLADARDLRDDRLGVAGDRRLAHDRAKGVLAARRIELRRHQHRQHGLFRHHLFSRPAHHGAAVLAYLAFRPGARLSRARRNDQSLAGAGRPPGALRHRARDRHAQTLPERRRQGAADAGGDTRHRTDQHGPCPAAHRTAVARHPAWRHHRDRPGDRHPAGTAGDGCQASSRSRPWRCAPASP